MHPNSCCEGGIRTIASEILGEAFEADETEQEKKLRENQRFPELSSVGLIGFEPTTSTLPELRLQSAKPYDIEYCRFGPAKQATSSTLEHTGQRSKPVVVKCLLIHRVCVYSVGADFTNQWRVRT